MNYLCLQEKVIEFNDEARKLRGRWAPSWRIKSARNEAAEILQRIADRLEAKHESGLRRISEADFLAIVREVKTARLDYLRAQARAAAKQLAQQNEALAANFRASDGIDQQLAALRADVARIKSRQEQ